MFEYNPLVTILRIKQNYFKGTTVLTILPHFLALKVLKPKASMTRNPCFGDHRGQRKLWNV